MALDDILPRAHVERVREGLLAAETDEARCVVIQQFLLGLPLAPDPLVGRALQLLGRTPPVAVAQVARELCIARNAARGAPLRRPPR